MKPAGKFWNTPLIAGLIVVASIAMIVKVGTKVLPCVSSLNSSL